MVVQEDDAPVEAAVSKQSKRYVIVKNHVRELMPDIASSGAVAPKQEVDKCIKMKNKNLKKRKQGKEFISSEPAPTDMSRSDTDELRAVYKKCKQILKKMESKYGHLLDLDDEDSISKRKKTETSDEETESDSCNCLRNKKIVFDENGQQIEKVCALENHICPKRIKKRYDDQIKTSEPLEKQLSVQVEYDQCEKIRNELSDSLEELGEILKNPNIDNVYRKMVIDKIYMKRQDHLFEIRNERKFLVEKLKENADELLDFKGSNISTLPGYPKNPTDNDEAVNKL